MRTLKYISVTLLLVLMLLLGTAYALFQSNSFQNWLTDKLGDYLSAQFKTKISIGHINYKPLQTFELEEVLFGDHKNDTLFYVGKLNFTLAGFKLDSSQFRLSNVKVTDAYCHLKFYEDSSFNIDVLFNILDPNDTIPSTGPPFTLHFDKVTLENARFSLENKLDTSSWGKAFAPNNQYFYNINAKAEDFYIIQDSLHFILSHLDLKERSGFKANHIQAITTISPGCMLFDSLLLRTPYTTAGNSFGMRYKSYKAFGNFYDDVKLDINLNSSVVDLKDVAFFAEALTDFPYKFKVKGKADGTISNLSLKDLDVRFGQTGMFSGSADLNGMPDMDNTFIDAEVKQILVTKADMEYLAQMPMANELVKLGLIKFKGQYTGFFKDFVAYGEFNTALGDVVTDLNMKIADEQSDYEYSGKVDLRDFNLGSLIDQKLIGKLSAVSNISGKGFDFKTMLAEFNADVTYIDFYGYQYQNVTLAGKLNNRLLNAELLVDDANLNLRFNGGIDLSKDMNQYNFNAKIRHANLLPLGFDTADITLNADADINFAFKDLDRNKGQITITDLSISKYEDLYAIKQVYVNSINNNGNRTLQLKTDNIDAEIKGEFNLLELGDAADLALHQLIPEYFKKPANKIRQKQDFEVSLQVKTLYPFNELYFPDIEVRNAQFKGAFNENNQQWYANAYLGGLRYGKTSVRGITVKHTKNSGEGAELLTSFNRLLVNDTLYAKDAAIKIVQNKNTAAVNLMVKDSNSLFTTNTLANVTFTAGKINTVFDFSQFKFRSGDFELRKGSSLCYTGTGLDFTNFYLTRNTTETILVNGVYGFNSNHNMLVDASNIRLNLINDLVPQLTILTDGILNGNITVSTKNNGLVIGGDATLTELSLDKDTLGDFRLLSSYANDQNRLMAFIKSVKGKLRNLEIGGYYDLSRKNDALNFTINFDESDITSFQAFVKDYIKLLSGNVRASGQLSGSFDKPEFNCNVDFMGVTLMVDYLKTLYSFSTSININEQQLTINPTEVRDVNDHRGTLSGVITHNNFSNFKTNLKFTDLKDFQLLNTGPKDNDLFYGRAYADGALTLTGPFTDLLLDAKFTGKEGTVVNIPLSTGYGDGEDGLIHFVNKDSTRAKSDYKRSGTLSGFAINCMLHVTKSAEINIVLDEQQGDKIRGRGNGDIKLELTRSGQFNMYGEVEVDEGDYKFTAMNLFTKKFILKPGGKISWTGDPVAGQMNIVGVYNVRTSVADIVAGATNEERESLKQQRVPVECLLYVKGSLLNPDIKFDMNITDVSGSLPGNTVSELQNTLRVWRNENELMTQQVISLMLFGRFTPTNVQNSTGPTNLSAGVNNTLSGFVSAQATNFIQQLIPGLDVNVDYHTGTESVRGRTIVSASKRILDNRLEIQASIDPINTYQNFLTQYNLTRSGNLKAKAFSRAQLDPIYNRNINTNGVGLYYRKEFDKFSDLFSNKNKKVNNLSQ